MSWLLAAPFALLSPGCASIIVSAAPGYDVGTLGVSGTDDGIGGQFEMIGCQRAAGQGLGAGPVLEFAGYDTAADADPIFFTTIDARYRRLFGATSGGPYWTVGSGFGVAWSPRIHRAAVPLQAEVGVQARIGALLLAVAARERFIGLVGTGSPPVDAFNSVQLVLGAGFGR